MTVTIQKRRPRRRTHLKELPEVGYIRVCNLYDRPGIPGLLGVSKSTYLRWVKRGLIKTPTKLGPRASGYPAEYVKSLMANPPGSGAEG